MKYKVEQRRGASRSTEFVVVGDYGAVAKRFDAAGKHLVNGRWVTAEEAAETEAAKLNSAS